MEQRTDFYIYLFYMPVTWRKETVWGKRFRNCELLIVVKSMDECYIANRIFDRECNGCNETAYEVVLLYEVSLLNICGVIGQIRI